SRIREVVPDLTRITNVADVTRNRSSSDNDPVYVLLPAAARDGGCVDRLIDAAIQYREQIFFILISDDIPATDYKRLVRTGGADWASTDGAPQEIIDIIAKRRQSLGQRPATSSASARANPVAVAFVPSAGGVGNATLVSEIGVRLKTGKGAKD